MIKNYEVDGDKTEYTLEDKFCRTTKNSETLVNWILSHDALQELFEETYVSTVSGKLKVHIPLVHGLALQYDGYRQGEGPWYSPGGLLYITQMRIHKDYFNTDICRR